MCKNVSTLFIQIIPEQDYLSNSILRILYITIIYVHKFINTYIYMYIKYNMYISIWPHYVNKYNVQAPKIGMLRYGEGKCNVQ